VQRGETAKRGALWLKRPFLRAKISFGFFENIPWSWHSDLDAEGGDYKTVKNRLKARDEKVRKEIRNGGVMDGKKLSKSHVKFWEGRLSHPKSLSAASAFPNWYVQMAHDGKQCQFSLGTPNKAEAARQAKEAYFLLKGHGWNAVWAKYGKKKRKEIENCGKAISGASDVSNMTFGEYMELIERKCTVGPETIFDYKARLRVLLSSMFKINPGNKKYDHFNKVNEKYEEGVFSIKITDVTESKVETWKCEEYRKRVEGGGNPDSVATTINSIIRGCSNAFCKKTLKELGVGGEFISPFSGVAKLREGSKRYFSRFSAKELLFRAEKDLKGSHHDQFAVIVLALLQGLRANEIDKIIWSQINLEEETLSVMQTKYFNPKTRSSCKTIPLNDYVADVLRWLKSKGSYGEEKFVVAPELGIKKGGLSREKRCGKVFDGVIQWLRDFGIGDQKPIHTLRKECGSMIYRQTGDIYSVALYLRDTLPVVVSCYADATVGKVPRLSLELAEEA
jgi:hypothetical protein